MHKPAVLSEIVIEIYKHEKSLQVKDKKSICHSIFDLRAKADQITSPITEKDLDILDDGKCGIMLLMRKHNVKSNPGLNDVKLCVEVFEEPKFTCDIVQQYENENSNWEDDNLDFSSYLGIDKKSNW